MCIERSSAWVDPLEELHGARFFVDQLQEIEPALLPPKYEKLDPQTRQIALMKEINSHAKTSLQETPLITSSLEFVSWSLQYPILDSPAERFDALYGSDDPDNLIGKDTSPSLKILLGTVSTTLALIGNPRQKNGETMTWTLNGIGDLPTRQTLTMTFTHTGVSISLITPVNSGKEVRTLAIRDNIPSFNTQFVSY